jgi:hypothetical protein
MPKTKLTPELQEKVVLLLKAGHYQETVCESVGIDPSNFRRWMERGKREKKGIYHDLRAVVTGAMAEAEIRGLEVLRLAALDGQPQWAAWILERRNCQHWGKRDKLEHAGEVTLHHDMDELTDEEVNARIAELDSRLPGPEGAAGPAAGADQPE